MEVNEEIIKKIYEAEFGVVKEEEGYTLQIYKNYKNNYVVVLWYGRSSWVDNSKVRQVVYNSKGEKIS